MTHGSLKINHNMDNSNQAKSKWRTSNNRISNLRKKGILAFFPANFSCRACYFVYINNNFYFFFPAVFNKHKLWKFTKLCHYGFLVPFYNIYYYSHNIFNYRLVKLYKLYFFNGRRFI